MNTDPTARDADAVGGEEAAHDPATRCDDIQAVLFDYMSRELGAARSDLVRQHLRKCPECQRAAAEIQATLDLMRRASREEAATMPAQLSEDRRRLMLRAVMHPVLDWMYRHHVLASLLATAAALAALGVALWFGHALSQNTPAHVVPVNIDGGPPAGYTPPPPTPRHHHATPAPTNR